MKRLVLVLMFCFSLAAIADDEARFNARYNDLGLKVQCTCGCGQQLIKCNHVGCQYSDKMIRELRASLINYSNDDDVLNWFRRNYGVTAVIEPGTHGFELLSWLMPPLLTFAAFLLVFLLIRRWRVRATLAPVPISDPSLEELKARARRETEL